jgi:urease accessory protein
MRRGRTDFRVRRGAFASGASLLVVNKIDLAPFVGVDPDRMLTEACSVRSGRPVLTTNCRTGEGIEAVVRHLEHEALFRR